MMKNYVKCMKVSLLFVVCLLELLLGCDDETKSLANAVSKPVGQEQNITYSSDSIFKSSKVYIGVNKENDSTYFERKWNGVPSIEIINNDHLLVAFNSRKGRIGGFSNGEGPETYITVSMKVLSENNWIQNVIVVKPVDATERIFDPCLWKDPKGNIHLFWTKSKPDSNHVFGVPKVWETCLTVNNKEISYTEPRLFMDNTILLNKPITLGSTILYPTYVYDVKNYAGLKGSINVFKGSIEKKSISIPSQIYIDTEISQKTQKSTYWEPMLVKLRDIDSLYCFVRTEGGIFFGSNSYQDSNNSFNGFSNFKKLSSIGINPESRFHIRTLRSGKVLLVSNLGVNRSNMTAMLCDNNNFIFTEKKLIDARGAVSYPDVSEDEFGNIYVVYDRERTGAREILMTVFNESQLKDPNFQLESEIVFKPKK